MFLVGVYSPHGASAGTKGPQIFGNPLVGSRAESKNRIEWQIRCPCYAQRACSGARALSGSKDPFLRLRSWYGVVFP